MPIERDEWFDAEGNMDFEEVQEDLSFASDMVGMAQRAETNRLLREQAAERKRLASLPDCIYCGGKLPKIGVVLCMHCKGKLDWVGEIVCTPNPEGRKLAKARWDEVCRRREEEKRAEAVRKAQSQKQAEEFASGCIKPVAYLFLTYVGLGVFVAMTAGFEAAVFESSDGELFSFFAGLASVPALVYLLMRRDGFKQLRIRDQSGRGRFLVCCCWPAFICGVFPGVVLTNVGLGVIFVPISFFAFRAIYNRLPNWLSKAEKTEVPVDQDYWIMRGEELHGPFKAVSLVEAAKYKQLKKRDLLGNSPSGPWQKLTKEHLQSMHQGNDVEIK